MVEFQIVSDKCIEMIGNDERERKRFSEKEEEMKIINVKQLFSTAGVSRRRSNLEYMTKKK